jgi:RNA polymerase sigma factor (sigma-70 family)
VEPLDHAGDDGPAPDLLQRISACLGSGEWDRLAATPSKELLADRISTRLMDQFRRTRSELAFALLFELERPAMLRRIRRRLRGYGSPVDESDVLQEVFLNVYRYPDRFRSEREGAFRAWSGAIVENSIRRLSRRQRSGRMETSNDLLEMMPASPVLDPFRVASSEEDEGVLERTFLLLMVAYMQVYSTLSTRERFVLQLVEIDGLRYKDAARCAGVRPEALKMVVFRARKRIYSRLVALLSNEPLRSGRN